MQTFGVFPQSCNRISFTSVADSQVWRYDFFLQNNRQTSWIISLKQHQQSTEHFQSCLKKHVSIVQTLKISHCFCWMIWLEHYVWNPNRPTLVASHFGKYSTEQKKPPLQEKVVTPKICDKSMKHLNLHEGSQCFVSNSILAENQQILVENHLSAPRKFV